MISGREKAKQYKAGRDREREKGKTEKEGNKEIEGMKEKEGK